MAQTAGMVTAVYGALVLLGGLMGYLKAKSRPSLIMGGAFGVALTAVGVAGTLDWKLAPVIAWALAAPLLVFFAIRFARKKKFMPAGLIAALSLVAFLVNLAAHLVGLGGGQG